MNERCKRCETMNGIGFLAKEGFGWSFPTSFPTHSSGGGGVFMLRYIIGNDVALPFYGLSGFLG